MAGAFASTIGSTTAISSTTSALTDFTAFFTAAAVGAFTFTSAAASSVTFVTAALAFLAIFFLSILAAWAIDFSAADSLVSCFSSLFLALIDNATGADEPSAVSSISPVAFLFFPLITSDFLLLALLGWTCFSSSLFAYMGREGEVGIFSPTLLTLFHEFSIIRQAFVTPCKTFATTSSSLIDVRPILILIIRVWSFNLIYVAEVAAFTASPILAGDFNRIGTGSLFVFENVFPKELYSSGTIPKSQKKWVCDVNNSLRSL